MKLIDEDELYKIYELYDDGDVSLALETLNDQVNAKVQPLVDALRWAVDLHNQLEDMGVVHYDPNIPSHLREIVKARQALKQFKED